MAPLAGYVRVSHVGGRGGDSFHSPDEQAAEIRAWARTHSKDVEMLSPELDAKGSDAHRPIFRNAIDGIRTGAYSGLVVAYLSRAGRDLRLMLDLWDEVEQAGGTIYAARENIDASTPTGRLQRNILASIAQHELEERREGFERARSGAVAAGIWQRRQTPRGYRRDKTSRRLVPDRNAEKVRAAFAAYIAGAPVVDIAASLGMTPSGVRQLLQNRVYLGELRVGEHVNPRAHEALIDVATFEAAAERIRNGTRPARGKHAGPALLAGLVRCESCGHAMTRGNSNGLPMYACPTRHSGARCPAPASIMTGRLDSYVEPIALAELARIRVTASEGDRVQVAQASLATAERELSAYLETISVEDVGAEAFSAGALKRRATVDEARTALQGELARRPGGAVGTFDAAAAWSGLNPHERNTLLRGLLSAVIVRPANGKVVPVPTRVRVLPFGVDLKLPRRNGHDGAGIVPLDNLDNVDELGVALGQDPPKRLTRVS